MMFRTAAVALVILGGTTMWAQAGPSSSARSRSVVAKSNVAGLMENAHAQTATHQRVEEMRNTLAKMHALLKQMQAKTAASGSKDSAAKANLEMWTLMLSDLDKQFEQLNAAAHSREDLEARRAAMYRQAETRAALEAQTAKAAAVNQAAAATKQDASVPEGATATAPAAAQPASTPTSPSSPNDAAHD